MDSLKTQITEDEKKFREKQYPSERSILQKMKMCTVCGRSITKEIQNKDEIHIHPVLEVLWCKECEEFYTKDDKFPVDEDGSDIFCRWCGQGGHLYCCSNCPAAFCDECIMRNFSKKILKNIQNDEEWMCFVCDNKPLWSLRALCDAAKRYFNSELMSRKTTRNCCTFCCKSRKSREVGNVNDHHDQLKPADEKKTDKFRSIVQEAVEELAALRKLVMEKEKTWKKNMNNINETSRDEVLKLFADIETTSKTMAKSFATKFEKLSPIITDELQIRNRDEENMSLTFNSMMGNICSFSSGHLSLNTSEEDELRNAPSPFFDQD